MRGGVLVLANEPTIPPLMENEVPRSSEDQSSSVWMKRPERSFGSNQVLLGGMI